MVKDFFSKDKKIYDSLHGFVRFGTSLRSVIDSVPFQRLHYIHQLGISYLVYPGATHTRFEHSLGVMELATRIFHNLCKSVRPDVFALVPRKGSAEYHYWRKVLRMAALCHDIGHLPFSHVAEKELLGDKGHESITYQLIHSRYLKEIFKPLQEEFAQIFPDRDFIEDISKIALGEKKYEQITQKKLSSWEKVVSEIITGDFFGADRIDYLLRDSKSTGVAYGVFDYEQLIEMLRILPCPEKGIEALSLGINENGLESCEALLLARHFMNKRIYQYSSVKAYNFHLKRFLQLFFEDIDLSCLDTYLSYNDADIISALGIAAKDPKRKGNLEAQRIMQRKHRFKALALNQEIPEEELLDQCKKKGIPNASFAFEPKKIALSQKSLAFPVSRRHLMVEAATECSDLLNKVAHSQPGWIYFSPDYEEPILEALDNLKSL